MAEFCEECFRKLNPECAGYSLEISRDKDFCEGCAKWKRVVIGFKPSIFNQVARKEDKEKK